METINEQQLAHTHMQNLVFRDAFTLYDQVFLIPLSDTESIRHWDNDLYKYSQNEKSNIGSWDTLLVS